MEALKLALSAKQGCYAREIEMINLQKLLHLLSKLQKPKTKKPFTIRKEMQYQWLKAQIDQSKKQLLLIFNQLFNILETYNKFQILIYHPSNIFKYFFQIIKIIQITIDRLQSIQITYLMTQKSGFNLMALQKNIQECLAKPNAKQSCFMFEYKLLLLYSANFGIYVMPQNNAIDTWHGVVFVRYGIFKDAKFKFKMQFENFPKNAPKVYFMSQVYHPNVNIQTGLLDLGNDLQKDWNYGTEHLIFTVIQYIRLLFLDVRFYENTQSYNKAAGLLFNSSPDQFFIKVRQCVENSKNQLFQNYQNTSFKFTPFTAKHQKIRDNLKEICQDQNLSIQEKKKKFIKSLKENS